MVSDSPIFVCVSKGMAIRLIMGITGRRWCFTRGSRIGQQWCRSSGRICTRRGPVCPLRLSTTRYRPWSSRPTDRSLLLSLCCRKSFSPATPPRLMTQCSWLWVFAWHEYPSSEGTSGPCRLLGPELFLHRFEQCIRWIRTLPSPFTYDPIAFRRWSYQCLPLNLFW